MDTSIHIPDGSSGGTGENKITFGNSTSEHFATLGPSNSITSKGDLNSENLNINSNMNLQNVVNLERFSSYSDVERNTSLFPQEVTNSIFSISQLEGDNSIISRVHLGDAYIIQLLDVKDFEGVISLEEITETKNALNLALNEIEKDYLYGQLREKASIN